MAQRREVLPEVPGLANGRLARVPQGLPTVARVSQGLPSEKQARVSLHPRSRSISGRWGWRRRQRD